MATPGKIAKFGPTGNVIDSIITETDAGSIGIGTTAPSVKTQIEGGEGVNDQGATFALRRSDNNKFMRLGVGTQGAALDFDPTSFLVIQKNTLGIDGVLAGQELLRVTSSGNLGIGTPSPDRPLAVQAQGLDQELISFKDPGGATKWHINQDLGGSNPGLNFVETGVADGRLFLQAGGNVGIGTTGPNARLTVETSAPDIGDFTFLTGVQGTVINNRGAPDSWRQTAGVRGSNSSGYGVQGQSDSFVGVKGNSNSSMGVFGQSDTGIGVAGLATNTSSGAAGFFQGSVQVAGALSKSGGGFRIDHPLDSANKYMNHSFVESPEMKNVYDGVAVLDAGGEAVVMLPDWFEALNEGFRYQLTPVGAPAPQLHVADEIAHAQFRIAGGVPGQRVCWQVTGVRKDPWARAHPVVVEEPKIGDERGHYLNPEVFGQQQDQSILAARYPNVLRRQT